ncbi:MAG: type II toxin-antitoxin system VapC family toxin [Proteobacteria bacterium]|nr:type II toxin-antitoxin system VapC family toxin [Pseudomonadota bacterium]
MKYILDTCVVSELAKQKPEQGLIKWINQKDEIDFFLSVLTIGELQKGVSKLEESRNKQTLIQWVESDLIKRFENRILPVTDSVAKKWGKIQGKAELEGKKMPVIDSLIAATGLVYDFEVVTRNTTDMEISGVRLFNPWQLK